MRYLPTLFTAILLPLSAWGQAVPSREPSSTHIFPAGGQRGTTVKVRVGGECLPPGMDFKLSGSGVTAPHVLGPEAKGHYESSVRRPPRDADGVGAAMIYPREWESSIAIAADAEPGARLWRVAGAWGGTRPRPFLVGDLPEFIETEPNSSPERAERLTLPVVVNGQIAGERDQDFFVFTARAGEVVVCDVMAGRIGSPLDPVIAVTDLRGQRMDVREVRVGGDPVVAFRVPTTGDYRLHVANLGYYGGPAYVYRITISTMPYTVFAFPPSGPTGQSREVESFTLTGTRELRAAKEKVAFPATPGPFLWRGIPLNSEESAAVTSGDNHSPQTAMELAPPTAVDARFRRAGDEDWFRFTAKKDEAFTISCLPFPADSAALPVLALFDPDGKALLKASAIEAPEHRIELDWKAPADGIYRLRLRDLQHGSRGGPEFIYRLNIRPARPDFTLRLDSDFVNVVQNGKTDIDLLIQRSGGFTGPIDLTATGLPEGVKIEPARVPDNQTRIKLSVSAKDDAKPTDAVVNIRGTATINGQPAERRAMVSSFGCESDSLHVTVQHKPLFKLTCNEAYQYGHRGTIYPYAMKVERLNGFAGPIKIQLCERQVQDLDGIEIVETVVPPGATEFKNLIYLPETMHAGVQHHSRPYVQGYATFTDPWGRTQTLLAVCDKRCMVRTMPPVAKLRAVTNEIVAEPGKTVECKLALDRTSNFTGAAEVELLEPVGFQAEKMRIEEGQLEVVMRINIAGEMNRSEGTPLRFRATGKMPAGATLVTEATVSVRFK